MRGASWWPSVAVCGLVALLAPGQAARAGDILELTDATFESAVEFHPLLLVLFYAPWCGHSQRLKPEFEKAAEVLKGKVRLAQVDATTQVGLAEQFRIEGYPTMYFFNNGAEEEYSGGRTSSTIVSWVKEHSGSALVTPSSEHDLSVALEGRRSLPFFVARGGPPAKELFGRLAEEHRAMGVFFFREDLSNPPAVIQVHRGFNETVELKGPDALDEEKVMAFIEAERLPAFGEIHEENSAGYLARAGEGMLWICFSPGSFREEAEQKQGVFQRVAASFPQFPVVYLDTMLYEEHAKESLGCDEFPTLVLQIGNFTDEQAPEPEPKTYKVAPGDITEDAVVGWINSVLAGEVKQEEGLAALDADDAEAEEEEEEGAEDGGERATSPPPMNEGAPPASSHSAGGEL
uniref:Thioredoxin domain-containing protein n=1 Tax=Alexandrium monilatum TaxID=311494 RepID=A0A7S4RFU2_9DINO